MKNKVNIVLTGGHGATTAIAVVEEVKSRGLNWKIYFIGVKTAMEGKNIKTLESEILPKYGVDFLPLTTGRLQRKFTLWTIPSVLKIPAGFFQSIYYLVKIRPEVLLSFGGFASAPVIVAAKMLRIPVIIHEQTATAGRANLFAAKFANIIALAREQSIKYFPSDKSIVIGNPIIYEDKNVMHKSNTAQKTIFVTGGSRGSQTINSAVGLVLPKLLAKYRLIHQTGELDLTKFNLIKKSLPENLAANYTVFARVDPMGVTKIFRDSNLVIARAGANTVSDILAAKKSCILIPLPISYLDEQTKNAKYAERFGNTAIINQKDLSAETLLNSIESVFSKLSRRKHPVHSEANPDLSAAGKLVDLLTRYIN